MSRRFYSDHGNAWRAADPGWQPGEGEVAFDDEPTEAALLAAFPGRAAAGLQAAIAARCNAIDAERDRRLKAGKLFGGLHVALLDKLGTDGPRADLGGMVTTAGFVLLGIPGVTWPASFQLGWISVENERIAMPTPADGLALAASAGDYFAAVVQVARDKKDDCLEAADLTELEGISIETGWPENIDPLA